jgi:hypothetical protein
LLPYLKSTFGTVKLNFQLFNMLPVLIFHCNPQLVSECKTRGETNTLTACVLLLRLFLIPKNSDFLAICGKFARLRHVTI